MRVVCPICETENEDRDHCRQCSTDLGPLIRVLDLSGSMRADHEDRQQEHARAAGQARHVTTLLWALPAAAFLLGAVLVWLRPAPGPEPPPVPLPAVVQQALDAHAGTRGLPLRVTDAADRVTIAGQVPTAVHASLVEAVARQALLADAAARHAVPPAVDVSGLKVPPPPAEAVVTYTVRSGDSLWSIAARTYGNPSFWRHIASANGNPADPARLEVGQRLVLPPITLPPR